MNARYAIIIPACDEAECIRSVLAELLATIDPADFVVALGVNGSSDETVTLARQYPVLVAMTGERGYGYGCMAAIELLRRSSPPVDAYIFFAADGANDPRDIPKLVAAYQNGATMVLGARTMRFRNWRIMSLSHVFANLLLGIWCGLLTGRLFTDLGPLRLIDRALFEDIALSEMTFGWTIEAQMRAAQRGGYIQETKVNERRRLAGQQKVSGVTWRRTFLVGCQILAASVRAWRKVEKPAYRRPAHDLLPNPSRTARST